jgi:hypothetical protein
LLITKFPLFLLLLLQEKEKAAYWFCSSFSFSFCEVKTLLLLLLLPALLKYAKKAIKLSDSSGSSIGNCPVRASAGFSSILRTSWEPNEETGRSLSVSISRRRRSRRRQLNLALAETAREALSHEREEALFAILQEGLSFLPRKLAFQV